MKKINKSILFCTAALTLLSSCAEEYNDSFKADQPESAALASIISKYDVLKKYAGNMKIGAELPASAVEAKGTAFSQMITNFNQLTFSNGKGNMEDVPDSISVFGSSLCSPTASNSAKMKELVADTYIPGSMSEKEFTIQDFESLAIGTKIPGSGGTPAEVVEDPDGASGHCLHYTAGFNHPYLDIKLPEGVTVGDLTTGEYDYRTIGTGWIITGVLKVIINGTTIGGDIGGTASSWGIGKNEWGRGKYKMDFTKLEFNEEQKKATSFQLGIGEVVDNPNYYIDNIKMKANYMLPGHYEVRPMEEKTAAAEKELNESIKASIEAANGKTSDWVIADNAIAPGTSESVLLNSGIDADANHFYYNEYLGDNYVASAAKMAHAVKSDLNLWYSETNLESDPVKLERCCKMLKQWNNAGANLSGINAVLHLNYSAESEATTKSNITNMLKQLAATGLKVRLSGLDMTLTNADGSMVNSKDITTEDQKKMSALYNYIVTQYQQLIPDAQRYGISLSSYNAGATSVGLWNSDFNRRATYAGMASGLKSEANPW